MGPDWLWVAVFSLGGVSMGFITALVGLKKGREFFGWLALYAFMVTVTVILDLSHAFWTVLAGSLGAGLGASTIQVLFMDHYRRNNPWYEAEMQKSRPKVAAGFIGFALLAGLVFGLVMGGVAWGIALL